MPNNVRIGVGVKDDASTPLDRIRDSFERLQKKGAEGILAGVAAGATVAGLNLISGAVGQLTGFLEGSIQAAMEEETGIRRLGAVLSANVASWDGNTEAIERQVKTRMRLGFSDDELRQSLGTLVAATHDVNQAFEIQTTAMDLARFKGISLGEATDALTKVEAGSYRILKSLGIQLQDGATQTQALAAVQKVAGGQAEAFGETTAGAMMKAQVAWNEAQETLGQKLLPVVTKLANFAANDLAPALGAVFDNLDKLVPVVETLAILVGVKLVGALVGAAASFVVAGIGAGTFATETGAATAATTSFSGAVTASGLAAKAASGIAVASIFAVLATYNQVKGQIDAETAALDKQTEDFVKTASLDALQTSRANVADLLDQTRKDLGDFDRSLPFGLGNTARVFEDMLGLSAAPKVQAELDKIDAEITQRLQQMATDRGAIKRKERMLAERDSIAITQAAERSKDRLQQVALEALHGQQEIGEAELATRRDYFARQADVEQAGIGTVADAIVAAREDIQTATETAMGGVADGINASRDGIHAAMIQLQLDLKNAISPEEEKAFLIAALELKPGDIKANKASKDEYKRLGATYAQQIVDGLKSKDPVAVARAEELVGKLRARFADLETFAESDGRKTMEAYAHGLLAGGADAINATKEVLDKIRRLMRAQSPPGPESPLHEIDLWGERTGRAWTGGFGVGLAGGPGMARSALDRIAGGMGFGAAARRSAPAYEPAGSAMGGSRIEQLLTIITGQLARVVAQEPLAATPQTARGDLARMAALMPGGRL